MLYPESEYKRVFGNADIDKDGYIDYADLRKLVLDVDKQFPEGVIKQAFKEAKIRIPPADKMDLAEFLEAMGKLEAYNRRGTISIGKGPILYKEMSASLVHLLRTPRFARWLYEQFFHETDTDNDGFIVYEEFLVTLRKYELEYLAYTVQLEFKKHNTRGDGYMSLNEFMIAMGFPPLNNEPIIKKPAPAPQTKAKKPKGPKFELGASLLRNIFESMDQDKDGVLNRQELKGVFQQLGQDMSEEEIDAMVKANDKEGDGCLSYDEFINSVYPTVIEKQASGDEEEEEEE